MDQKNLTEGRSLADHHRMQGVLIGGLLTGLPLLSHILAAGLFLSKGDLAIGFGFIGSSALIAWIGLVLLIVEVNAARAEAEETERQ